MNRLSFHLVLTAGLWAAACGGGAASVLPPWASGQTNPAQSNCESAVAKELFCTLGHGHAASESSARQLAEADAADQLAQSLVSKLTSAIKKDSTTETQTATKRVAGDASGQGHVSTGLGEVKTPNAGVSGSGVVESDEARSVEVVEKHFTREASAQLFGMRMGPSHWDGPKSNYHVIVTVPYESVRAYVEGLSDLDPKVKDRIMRAVNVLEKSRQ